MNKKMLTIPHNIRTHAIWLLVLVLVIVLGISGYLYASRDTNPIPADIQTQLTFSPFVIPSDTKDYSTSSYTFTAAEDKVWVLSYIIGLSNNSVTVTQYTQPPEFTDIPEYKDRFLTNIAKQYDTVQTANGVIYLGKMTRQNDKQLGIMLEKGLLIFMSPNSELDSSQWRNLGDRLEIQRNN